MTSSTTLLMENWYSHFKNTTGRFLTKTNRVELLHGRDVLVLKGDQIRLKGRLHSHI